MSRSVLAFAAWIACGCTAIHPDEIPDASFDAGQGADGSVDGGRDAGEADAARSDAGVDAARADDAGGGDAGPIDAGADAGGGDAGGSDAGPIDAGADADVTSMDAGERDAASTDAGPADAGGSDAGCVPTGPEIPDNGLDDDCDGFHGCYYDSDNDGYSRSDGAVRDDSVDADCLDSGEGRSSEPRSDCNDTSASISPGRPELADNGVDDDCDGFHGCFVDTDDDGHLPASRPSRDDSTDSDCLDPGEGTSADPADDCNDLSALVHGGATELCNTTDEDCDGAARNGCPSPDETLGVPPYGSGVGVTTGTMTTATCAAGQALSGMNVWTDGTYVTALQPVCREPRIQETPGSPEYQYALDWDAGASEVLGPIFGTASGTMHIARCASNYFVGELSGRTSTRIDQLTVRCARLTFTRSGSTWVSVRSGVATLGPYGGSGGVAFGSSCGALAGTGVRVWESDCGGTCVTGIAFGCSTVSYVPQ